MNKLVLILFVVVLTITLAVGGFFLSQTKFLSQVSIPNINYLFSPSAEKAAQSAANNCKETGFDTQDKAVPYIEILMSKAGSGQGPEKNTMSVINIGRGCWGIWVGDNSGNGNLYYENKEGSLVAVKSKFEIK